MHGAGGGVAPEDDADPTRELREPIAEVARGADHRKALDTSATTSTVGDFTTGPFPGHLVVSTVIAAALIPIALLWDVFRRVTRAR